MLGYLFTASCLGAVLSVGKADYGMSYYVSLVHFDETNMKMLLRDYLYVSYPKDSSRGNVSIPKGKRRPSKVLNKPLGPMYLSGTWTNAGTAIFDDGSAALVASRNAKAYCRLVDGDRFPDDKAYCYISVLYATYPTIKCLGRMNKCVAHRVLNKNANWKVSNMTVLWRNYTRSGSVHGSLKVTFKRHSGQYWTRVSLPISLSAVASLGQLLIPVTRSDRLLINALACVTMQDVFSSVFEIPAVGKYGGGAVFGNMVSFLLGLNCFLFVWTAMAHLLIQILSATALPGPCVGLLDWIFDRLDVVLFIPSRLVQQEENKAFTRRGDWFKLSILVDRVLLLVAVAFVVISFNRFYVLA